MMKFKVQSDEGFPDIKIELTIGINSGKSIIENEMKLRRDLTSFKVQNHVNGRRVEPTNTKIDGTTTATRPFRNLLSILEFCVKNIAGTTEDVEALKVIITKVKLWSKKISGCKACLTV